MRLWVPVSGGQRAMALWGRVLLRRVVLCLPLTLHWEGRWLEGRGGWAASQAFKRLGVIAGGAVGFHEQLQDGHVELIKKSPTSGRVRTPGLMAIQSPASPAAAQQTMSG